MWVSPNHPNPPRPPSAPEDEGQQLTAFPRGDGREELWVTLKTFEGRPYVAVRVWSRDDHGQFWPVKNKGVSVRLGELAGVVDALQRAGAAASEPERPRQPVRPAGQGGRQGVAAQRDERIGGGGAQSRGGAPGDRGRRDRPDSREGDLPRPASGEMKAGFSEFE